jgi:hypothetical protein
MVGSKALPWQQQQHSIAMAMATTMVSSTAPINGTDFQCKNIYQKWPSTTNNGHQPQPQQTK